MAAMCFSVYVKRSHVENNRANCFGGSAENFQKDLVKVFTGVKKNKTFNLTVATRHTIPELARCEPRSILKENRIKDLIAHYKSVRQDLESLEALMVFGESDGVDFAYNVRQTVNGLHRDLAKCVVWRDVLPYTPLPMHGLQLLHRQIGRSWGNGNFTDLIDSIIDIQG
jgi:hypothetical protein